MTDPHITTTVMFADISGSSRLYQQLGNTEANSRISGSIETMLAITRDHYGELVKTIGDEIMVHFPSANEAILAASAIQRSGKGGLPIRIGMASGRVIRQKNDLFGQAVNDAAAVARIAKGRQILLTEETAQSLDPHWRLQLEPFDKVTLKGGSNETQLFRVIWENTQSSQTANHTVIIPASTIGETSLTIFYDNKPINISAQDTPFTIGRSTSCKLTVMTTMASREHCDIIHRRGKFVLEDHSTNGTYVKTGEADNVYLRREEIPLLNYGVIGIGQTPEEANDQAIRFTLLKE